MKTSLRTKIVLLLSISLFLFGILSVFISYNIYIDTTISQNKILGKGIAKLVASTIDPNMVNEYLKNGEKAEGYLRTKIRLHNIQKSTPNIKFVYVYKILADGCHVVFDIDTNDIQGEAPGTIIPFDKAFTKYIPTLLTGGTIDPVISDEKYGWLLTTYVPVHDDMGVCQCYAAVDISMDWIRIQANNYLEKLAIIFFAIFIVLLITSIILSNSKIIIPINKMVTATNMFVYDNKYSLEKSLEWMRHINIKTGDEIENLYLAVSKMASDSVVYIDDIKKKNDAISAMQNAFILTLADMIESRDKNTGQHIRKTAEYVKIILQALKDQGIYKEEITDEFMKNVIKSAPLHDIGKINVPDAILNKPGKLTDEEFTLMKSHSSVGGEIISHIIDVVPDSDYLSEAKNLATYHHEKWNGSGYPAGLSKEDIPLSARVMAVADVFDALVSNRSYKKGFPYEKALAIIVEERETHFDPKIVDAFLAAKEEVLRVADQFKRMEDPQGDETSHSL
ncbi:MAG: HD domain-containing protein [Desulfovibrio sp.]|nr:HD domain-containing protein [Desulfovibrio sp.]